MLRVIARMDGTPFPSTARVDRADGFVAACRRRPTGREEYRSSSNKVQRVVAAKEGREAQAGLETAYCAETVAITYEEMGLLMTDKDSNWFDPGKFWSGDALPLAAGLPARRRNRGPPIGITG